MKKNLKLTIAALSVLLVMAIATTVASFSRADEPTRINPLAGADDGGTQVFDRNTNIDYIIMNSYTTPSADEIKLYGDTSQYHIIELGFGGESDFGKMCRSVDFEEYVINGNKSAVIQDLMNANKVDYDYINIASVGDKDSDTLQKIARADLIYISNLGGKNSTTNDLGEELYNLLHTYAIGDYKPLIIDSPNAKSGQGEAGGGGGNGGSGASADSTFNTVVKDYFSKQGIYYNTYEWNSSKSADTFLQGSIGDTYYVGINSRTAQNGWKTLYEKPSDELSDEDKNNPDKLVEAKVAKILVVSGDGSTGALYNNLMGTPEPATTLYTNDGTKTEPYVPDCPMYVAKDDFKKAYSTRYKYRPGYVEVETAKIDDIGTVSLDGYDLVIFEASCSNVKIGAAAYDRMVAAMKSKMYILYDSSLSTVAQTQPGSGTGTSGTGTGNSDNSTKSNYEQLYYMVATQTGMAMYDNIMPTNNSTVATMANSKSASICKPIADLINASSYRGIGGPKGSSNVFTVLEIQPAYPIDSTRLTSGKYYTQGVNMAPSGKTKEQIGKDVEYYQWELSEAKIADALDLDYNNVKVVHASVDELNAKHEEYLGTYDMIYIGANRSALNDKYNSYSSTTPGLQLQSWDNPAAVFAFLNNGGIGFKGAYVNMIWGNPRLALYGNASTFAGRDLSDYNVQELNEYVNAGMPIVISKDFDKSSALSGYVVSSKMKTFLNGLSSNTNAKVLWGFDYSNTIDVTYGGLGDTLTGAVSVFKGSVNSSADGPADDLKALYTGSTKRLSVAVTSRPAEYNLYDDSTKLSVKSLDFKYDASENGCDSELYIDDNGNGAFEKSEKVAAGKDGFLSYNVSAYGGGLIYWKLVVKKGNREASSTGSTYINPPKGEKQLVKVLELLPQDKWIDLGDTSQSWYGANGAVSLIFCTECQRATKPLTHNPVVRYMDGQGGFYYTEEALYSSENSHPSFGNETVNANGIASNITVDDEKVNIGKHRHRFGIVKYGGGQKYAANADDWDWNFADEIKDMYDFHLDVMTTRQYEALDSRIKSSYKSLLGNADELAKAATAVTDTESAWRTYMAGTEYKTANDDVKAALAAIKDKYPAYEIELQRLIDNENYYEFYSSFGSAGTSNSLDTDRKFYSAFKKWVTCNDKSIDLENKYMEALYKYNYLNSEGKDWLTGSYDTIIIGAAENFGDDDLKSGYDVLGEFSSKDGQIILFHESLSRFTNYGPVNITNAVRAQAGISEYYSATQFYSRQGNQYPLTSQYKYGDLSNWNQIAFYAQSASDRKQPGTDRAVQNNKCNVTTYPFTLSDKLNITGTHPVGYALNTDDVNVTPLYSLSTSSYQNENQTIYPASPFDGQDNYFIYKSGNVFYCGAGHSKVTGFNKDNNDERRLYINIVVNAVKRTAMVPTPPEIEVFDYGTTEKDIADGKGNDIIKPTDDGYSYSIEDGDDWPEFTFKANASSGTSITSVSLYYKLDPAFESMKDEAAIKTAMAYNKSVDKMIADSSTKIGSSTLLDIIANGGLADIDEASCPGLKLSADMFTPYGGNYTYIVIEVKDSKGNTSYQKIKVTKKPHLFDLT